MYNTEKMTARFTINFIDKTITGTKASFDKASKGYGPIYEELAAKMAAHPDFKPVIREQKKHTTKAKETYYGLDDPFMKAYISIQETAEQDGAEYEAVKKAAKAAGRKVYPLAKKWFLNKYEGFNMKDAKEAISNAIISGAIQNVKLAAFEEPTVSDADELENVA